MSTSPIPPPNHTELYGRVGIPVSIAILSAGLGGLAAGRIVPIVGFILLGLGIVGLVVMVHQLGWHRFTILHALIGVMTALFASWILLAYLLWVPKEAVVHDPPTAEDIAKATAPFIAERDTAITERDTARRELDAARRGAIPPPVVLPPTPKPEWSDQEIATRTELWHSIQNAVDGVHNPTGPLVAAYDYGDRALNIWETYIKQNRTDYLGGLAEFRKRVSEAAASMEKLRSGHSNYKDVSETIDQPYLAPLLDSIDDFSSAVSSLPEPLPPNYPKNIEAKAGAVRIQMDNFNNWISNVQSISKQKLKQLQTMSQK